MSRPVVLVALLLLAMVFTSLAWTTRDGPPDQAPSPAPAKGESPDPMNPIAPPSSAPRHDLGEGRWNDPRRRGQMKHGAPVEVRVVDARDMSPVAGLHLVVYSETRRRVHARAKSDSQGHARFDAVPNGTWVLRSARRPPFAAATTAFQPGNGEVLLRIDTGGTLNGRVVDSAGTSLSDIPVRIPEIDWEAIRPGERWRTSMVEVGRTDANGRFALDCVQSQPKALRLHHGEARAGAWTDVRADLHDPLWGGVRSARLEERIRTGQVLDVGDIVLPTPGRVGGRVQWADGAPVAGALVSTRLQRYYARVRQQALARADDRAMDKGPRDPGFALARGEAFTDEDGHFDLPTVRSARTWCVETQDGARFGFPLENVEPGEVREGLVLTLPNAERLTLDLRGADGRPALDVADAGDGTPTGRKMTRHAFHVYAIGDGHSRERHVLRPDASGLVRFSPDGKLADLRGLKIEAGGYLPLEHALEGGADPRAPLVLTLVPAPRLGIRLERDEAGHAGWHSVTRMDLRACLVRGLARSTGAGTARCCSLGSRATLALRDMPRALELSVGADEPYWLHVTPWHGKETAATQTFGPFPTGKPVASVVRIRPPAAPQAAETPSPGNRVAEAVAIEQGPPPSDDASVRAILVDKESGEAIAGAALRVEYTDRLGWMDADADEHGHVVIGGLEAGTYTHRASAPRYRHLTSDPFALLARGTVDLGVLELEPAPVLRAQVLEADGTPALGVQWAQGMELAPRNGRVEVFEHVEGPYPLRIEPPARQGNKVAGLQRAWIEDWSPEEEAVVTLAAWHDVEVHVHGVAEAHRDAAMWLEFGAPEAWVARGQDAGFGPARPVAALSSEEAGNGPRFALRLAAGRYPMRLGSGLYGTGEGVLVVEGTRGVQIVDVWVERR